MYHKICKNSYVRQLNIIIDNNIVIIFIKNIAMYKTYKKEGQDKYQRLLTLINNFKHTKQQMKLLQQIKRDTLFEVSLRFHRCEANKKYRFPFQPNILDSEDDNIPELKCKATNKNLEYDLNLQNKEKTINQIKIPIFSRSSPRQKIMTQPSEKEKARSLSRKIKRVLIGRIYDQSLITKQNFLQTYRIPTESTLSSQKNSTKNLITPRRKNGPKTCRPSYEKIRTEQSPEKKKPLMFQQFQTLTLKKIANRLKTQKSNQKKSRIQALVSDEIKRQTRNDHLIKCGSSALKIKSKNLLHKNFY